MSYFMYSKTGHNFFIFDQTEVQNDEAILWYSIGYHHALQSENILEKLSTLESTPLSSMILESQT